MYFNYFTNPLRHYMREGFIYEHRTTRVGGAPDMCMYTCLPTFLKNNLNSFCAHACMHVGHMVQSVFKSTRIRDPGSGIPWDVLSILVPAAMVLIKYMYIDPLGGHIVDTPRFGNEKKITPLYLIITLLKKRQTFRGGQLGWLRARCYKRIIVMPLKRCQLSCQTS